MQRNDMNVVSNVMYQRQGSNVQINQQTNVNSNNQGWNNIKVWISCYN